MRKSMILMGLMMFTSEALAHKGRRGHRHNGPKVHKKVKVVTPGVTVYVGSRPWSPHYVPPARSGYAWVAGHYRGSRWVPGHWKPVAPAPRPHVVYVVGHWESDTYVDGYWRDEDMSGHEWQDGYYDDEGTYVDGGWVLIAEDGTEVIMMDTPTDEVGAVEPPTVQGEPIPVEIVEEVDLSGGPTEAVESD
jgi:hypothetical protein